MTCWIILTETEWVSRPIGKLFFEDDFLDQLVPKKILSWKLSLIEMTIWVAFQVVDEKTYFI
jgi:hypothetical protein